MAQVRLKGVNPFTPIVPTRFLPSSASTVIVKAPPMVGPTWMRVHFVLGLDCSPLLFQGTALLCFLLHAFLIDHLCMSDVR